MALTSVSVLLNGKLSVLPLYDKWKGTYQENL